MCLLYKDINVKMPALTTNDSAVLHALFDAESSPSSAIQIDSSLPPFPSNLQITPKDHESLSNREKLIIKSLQTDSVSQETIYSAITALDALIDDRPNYPPAYANRAQALRMLVEGQSSPSEKPEITGDVMFTDPANTVIVSRLFADLEQAINLSTPTSPADPVPPVQARILADAHTHRGYLLLKAARARRDSKVQGSGQLWDSGSDQLEEMASRDFFLGGRYGNKIAQQMAVQTNPYAKMCGAVVKEAMRKEVR